MRFPGFTDEWKNVEISSVGRVVTGNTPSTKETKYYDNGYHLWASPSDLGNKKMIESTQTLLSDEGFSKTRIIPRGSVLVTCIGSTIGKMGMASKQMSTNQQINSIVIDDNNDNNFIYYAVMSRFPKYKGEIAIQAVPLISKSSFEKLQIPSCEINEQKKIGTLLSLLDERIATQNKIIENLQSLIKGLAVAHYYSSELESPIYIDDLGEPFSVMSLSKEQLSDEGEPCIVYGELFTQYGAVIGEVISRTMEDEGLTKSSGHDLLFPSSTTVDAISLIAPSALRQSGIILGGDMFGIKVNEDYSPEYLGYFFNYVCATELAKYAKGSTIIHLHYKDIAKHKISLPSLSTQKRFAKFTSKLQSKIDTERSLLSALQSIKNYMLSKLFI